MCERGAVPPRRGFCFRQWVTFGESILDHHALKTCTSSPKFERRLRAQYIADAKAIRAVDAKRLTTALADGPAKDVQQTCYPRRIAIASAALGENVPAGLAWLGGSMGNITMSSSTFVTAPP